MGGVVQISNTRLVVERQLRLAKANIILAKKLVADMERTLRRLPPQ